MNRCPISYLEITDDNSYHPEGLKKISRHISNLQPLPFTAEEQLAEAAARAPKMSIQGVQPKLSAVFDTKTECFQVVDTGGRFIIKPQHPVYLNLPENEDLSMKLAEATGIEVPLHGLVYGKDRSLAYFIKRFDRPGNRKLKLPLEDFAQLSEKKRETKYDSSVEKVALVIDRYCTFPQLEKVKLFKRILFSFLTGNEDMHLKNYSLITISNQTILSPAYDLLNTTIAMKGAEEESALPLGGKKSKLDKSLFIKYLAYERLNLNQKVISKILKGIENSFPRWFELIDISFLDMDQKLEYRKLLDERINRIF